MLQRAPSLTAHQAFGCLPISLMIFHLYTETRWTPLHRALDGAPSCSPAAVSPLIPVTLATRTYSTVAADMAVSFLMSSPLSRGDIQFMHLRCPCGSAPSSCHTALLSQIPVTLGTLTAHWLLRCLPISACALPLVNQES